MSDDNNAPIKRTVLDYNDLRILVPALDGKEKLVNSLSKFLSLDKVNWLHDHNCDTPGAEFVDGLLRDLDIKLRIDNEGILDKMGDKPFITVSNHPFGALDGIILIKILASRYPRFKVMVNMVLNYITAMRPNFIAVDPLASDDPAKRATTMKGIREAMLHVKRGNPLGFFPAGAVSKINRELRIVDRQWQPTIIRLIQQLEVPVVPIYFHGHNSTWFNILGIISWKLRTLRLPAEVFRKKGKTFHVSIGEPISIEELQKHASIDDLGNYLKERTYSMRKWK
ncbi:MAG: lysophospholipid acyltransferase family protein [Muribaculaceae bacterium]|nr:lysophospholipid acyltransferase family protein [Muribaculaceae bacterium]